MNTSHTAAGRIATLALAMLLSITACRSQDDVPAADTTGAPAIDDMAATPPGDAEGSAEDFEPRAAPDFMLQTLSGDAFHLGSHRGEVVLLNFWATWCGPCRIEIPDFIELQEELGDEGLQIVGVSLDVEGFEAVRPFAEEMGINYPLVVDVGEISEMYGGVYALPTSFIIDRQGQIRHRIPGMLTRNQLLPLLKELLDEPAAG